MFDGVLNALLLLLELSTKLFVYAVGEECELASVMCCEVLVNDLLLLTELVDPLTKRLIVRDVVVEFLIGLLYLVLVLLDLAGSKDWDELLVLTFFSKEVTLSLIGVCLLLLFFFRFSSSDLDWISESNPLAFSDLLLDLLDVVLLDRREDEVLEDVLHRNRLVSG